MGIAAPFHFSGVPPGLSRSKTTPCRLSFRQSVLPVDAQRMRELLTAPVDADKLLQDRLLRVSERGLEIGGRVGRLLPHP